MTYIKEENLEFKYFNCCGDEDLFPFRCPQCGHIMVFCYECDTLYGDLNNLENHDQEINHSDPERPAFSCPKCKYEFEYSFMKNDKYLVEKEDWIKSGFESLLNKNT